MPVAGWKPRLASMLVDLSVLAALSLVVLIGALEVGIGADQPVTDSRLLAEAVSGSGLLQSVPLLALAALVVLRLRAGASPGQFLLGLRVVGIDDQQTPANWRLLARGPAWCLALLPAGLGVLWMLRDRRGLALHDRLTGTRVVSEDESCMSLAQLQALL